MQASDAGIPIQAIAIPKVHSGDDIYRISQILQRKIGKEAADKVTFIPLIESARGIMQLREIVESDDRMGAMVVCHLYPPSWFTLTSGCKALSFQ